jgi:replicative DNA helicase
LLISHAAWAQVSPTLNPGDFYRPDHQKIYAAIESLHTDGKPVDAVTVSDYLECTGAIGDTGGLGYIGGLVRDTPSADNVETYAAVVRERAMLRQLNAFGEGVIRASTAPSEQTAAELLAKAQHQLTVLQSRSATAAERAPMAGLVCAASIKPQPIKWLWNGWIAAGKFHLLAGAPGTGKTTVAMAWAATISRGGGWPDGSAATVGDVLVWSSEDDPQDTLIPRLATMGADLNRIRFITTASDGDRRRPFDPATDIEQLAAAIRESGITPRLLVVDPVVSAVKGDSNQGSQTRRSLQPLVDFGAAHGAAILGISHFSKGTAGNNPTERVTGSISFAALARVVIIAAKNPDEQGGGRFIARSKSNIGVDSGGYGYELRQDTLTDHPGVSASTLLWGDAIEGDAREMLAQAEMIEDSETRGQNSEAVDWLVEQLRRGPMKATDVTKEAKNAGISDKSVRTARKKLGVTAKKQAFSGCWMLQLPDDEGAHKGDQGAQDAHILKAGALGAFDDKGRLGGANGIVVDDSEGL